MASKDWVMPLAASFCLGLVVLSLLALLVVVVRGHSELVFREGRRLALLVFVFFSMVWATFTFVDMFSTGEGFCEASAGISSFADQIARISILGLMIWRFAKIVTFVQQNIWIVIISGRLILGAVYVAFTKADFEDICVIKSQNPILPGVLLGADLALIGMILLRVLVSKVWMDWREDAASRMLMKCLLSMAAFTAWEGLSAPMILRKPQGLLGMRTVLPSIGYMFLAVFLCLFPSALVIMKTPVTQDMEENKPQIIHMTPKEEPESPRIGSPYALPMRPREHPLRVVNPSKISSRHSSGRWDIHAASLAGMLSAGSAVSSDPPKPPAKENSIATIGAVDVEARAVFSTATVLAPVQEQTNPRIPKPTAQLSKIQEANALRLKALRSTLSTLFPDAQSQPVSQVHPGMSEVEKRMSTMGNPLRSNAVPKPMNAQPPPRPQHPAQSFGNPPAAAFTLPIQGPIMSGRTVITTSSTAVASTDRNDTGNINETFQKMISSHQAGEDCRISTSETYKVQVGGRQVSIQRNSELYSPSAAPKQATAPVAVPEAPKVAEKIEPQPKPEPEASLEVQIVDADELDPEEKAALTPKPLVPIKRKDSGPFPGPSRSSSLRSTRTITRKPVPLPQMPQGQPPMPVPRVVKSNDQFSNQRTAPNESDRSTQRDSTESTAMIAHATSVKRPNKKAAVVQLEGRSTKQRSQRSYRSKRSSTISVNTLPSIKAESSAENTPVSRRLAVPPKSPKSPRRVNWHYRVGDMIPTFSRRVARQVSVSKAPPVPLRSAKRERATLQKKKSPQTIVKEAAKSLQAYKEPAVTPPKGSSTASSTKGNDASSALKAKRLSYASVKAEDRLLMIEAEDIEIASGTEIPWIIFPEPRSRDSHDLGTLSRRSSCALPTSLRSLTSVPEVPIRTADVKSVHDVPAENASPKEQGQSSFQILTLALGSPSRLLHSGMLAPSTRSSMQTTR